MQLKQIVYNYDVQNELKINIETAGRVHVSLGSQRYVLYTYGCTEGIICTLRIIIYNMQLHVTLTLIF